MTKPITRCLAAAVFASSLLAGCTQKPADKPAATAQQQSMADMGAMSMPVTIPKGALYTEADVRFMQGMIAHHAQAIYMSRHGRRPAAPTRACSSSRTRSTSRSMAEIRLMQDWLKRERAVRARHVVVAHDEMPGMLTADAAQRARRGEGRRVRPAVPRRS